MMGGNHDPRAFACPEQIVIDRQPNRHSGFGLGAHRCIGAHFARAASQIILQEALARMPDYELDRARIRKASDIGTMNAYITLPARFTPVVVSAAPAEENR
jgi:cytochrome P450